MMTVLLVVNQNRKSDNDNKSNNSIVSLLGRWLYAPGGSTPPRDAQDRARQEGPVLLCGKQYDLSLARALWSLWEVLNGRSAVGCRPQGI